MICFCVPARRERVLREICGCVGTQIQDALGLFQLTPKILMTDLVLTSSIYNHGRCSQNFGAELTKEHFADQKLAIPNRKVCKLAIISLGSVAFFTLWRVFLLVFNEFASTMYRVRSLIAIPLTFVILAIGAAAVLLLMFFSLGKAHAFTTKWVGWFIGRSVLWLVGVKLKVEWHTPKPPPAVYILNHASTLDIFIIVALGLGKIRFVAKKEIQYNPFFFLMTKATGQIFIDRGDSRAAVNRLRKTYDFLKATGNSIMLAPEGTREHKGRLGPFKKGAFRMAVDLNYPIVPIFIENAYELCPGKSLFIKPGTVTAHIHPPISTENWDPERLDIHIRDVRNWYLNRLGLPPE
jgi:1-acyl-sn-glycerol-3-phosphate acyltransferase